MARSIEPILPAIILAGGQARRMGGGDKARMLLAGRPMIAWVLERLSVQAAPIAISANDDPERWSAFSCPVLSDTVPGRPGPLGGILAGLLWAAGLGHTHVLTVPADTPFVPTNLAQMLRDAAEENPSGAAIAASRHGDGTQTLHPATGLWPVALAADLDVQLQAGERAAKAFAAHHGAAVAAFDAAPVDPFFNINTPDDLATAEVLINRLR